MAKPRPPLKYTDAEIEVVLQMARAGVQYSEIQKIVPMPGPYISHVKAGRIRVKR